MLLEREFVEPIRFLHPESEDGRVSIDRFLLDMAGIPGIAGGAEIFPDEGLDHILNKVPRATTAIQTTYYLGLFTSQTASTVPGRTQLLVDEPTGVTEVPSAAAYARVAVANTDWGAIGTNGSGRRTTSAQKSFPTSSGSWGTINGFFLADVSTHSGGVAVFYANFDDTTAVNVNAAGFTVQITPFFHIDA